MCGRCVGGGLCGGISGFLFGMTSVLRMFCWGLGASLVSVLVVRPKKRPLELRMVFRVVFMFCLSDDVILTLGLEFSF